jgi:hypothetical protein
MEIKTDLEESIKFTDDSGTTNYFSIGDDVICCVGDKRHTGKITQIGYFNEDNEEPEKALYIDTSTSKTSYSGEIVKLKDITYIVKNPLSDIATTNFTQEELEKNTFVTMLTSIGYDKQKVENLYVMAQKLMKQFNIPIEKVTNCIIYSLNNNCDISVPLKEICGIDMNVWNKNLEVFEKAQKECLTALVESLVKTVGETIKEYISE